jgi:hypothetical protein
MNAIAVATSFKHLMGETTEEGMTGTAPQHRTAARSSAGLTDTISGVRSWLSPGSRIMYLPTAILLLARTSWQFQSVELG